MDYSPPGSSVHGIFQPRILEWVAISFSKGPSQSRDWTCISCKSSALQVDSFTTESLNYYYFLIVKNESTYCTKKDTPTPTISLLCMDNFYSFQKSGLLYPGSLSWITIIQTWCLFSVRKFSTNKYSTNKKQSHMIFHTLPNVSISFSMCANLRLLNEWNPSFYS